MNMKMLALVLPFAMSTVALAEGSSSFGTTSQYMHQTDAGVFEVTPAFGMDWTTWKFKSPASGGTAAKDAKDSKNVLSVMGEYGITEMLSVGAKFAYENDNMTQDPNLTSRKGMTDHHIFLNGRTGEGPGQFRFGGDLSFATGKGNVDANGNGNLQSGGMALTPYVAYEMMLGNGLAGIRVAYDIVKTERTYNKDVKLTDGNSGKYALFYEMNMMPVVWGFDLALNTYAASKAKITGQSTVGQNNAYSDFEVATYAAWEFSPGMTLLPKIGYGSSVAGPRYVEAANTKSTTGFGASVGLRIAL